MKYSYEIPIKIESDLSLKILKESDSQQLFTLVDQNRSYLMEFLPWLNTTQRPTDSESFIKSVEKSNQLGKTLVLAIFKGSKISKSFSRLLSQSYS